MRYKAVHHENYAFPKAGVYRSRVDILSLII